MNNYKKEYYNIYSEFYSVNKYRELKVILHHGSNRLDHISRVSKVSFYLSKFLNLDYISCTRGSLLHDFFTLDDINKNKLNYNLYLKVHPVEALNNARSYFELNEIEEDIILSHMYPLTKPRPKYKESYIVCLSDKVVSFYEFFKFNIVFSLNKTVLLCARVFTI